MATLFASGRIIDLILCLVALEAAALVVWRLRRGGRLVLPPLLCNLGSGAALMLAIRAALTGADWITIAACLALSLMAHLAELRLRLREPIRRNQELVAPGTSSAGVAFPGHL
ncbi:hypothetical protein [Methylobacterium sp. 77]|uniref:hypothetical protein n=1 Tax=Methylobacterium sp. 77 TaxID=1101192 RepID=UPI000563C3DA|nr:hypothetical protein [Methylobacterium sp. 77]